MTISPQSNGFTDQELMDAQPYLISFARRLTRSKSDADDLVSSTNVRLLEYRRLYTTGNFKGWAGKMMYNLFASGYRRRTKFETQYDPDTYLHKQIVPANQDTGDVLHHISLSFDQLHHEFREVISLFVEGYTYQEMGVMLGIPEGTVRSRLSRARDKMVSIL